MSEQEDNSQKTEEPSQRKLDEVAKRGEVVKSQELATFFIFVGLLLYLSFFMPYVNNELLLLLRSLIENSGTDNPFATAITRNKLISSLLYPIFAPLLLIMAISLIGNFIQHKPVLSITPLQPKLSKISLLSGLKRLFSSEALINFAKGIIKILIVSLAISTVVWSERYNLISSMEGGHARVMSYVRELSLSIVGIVLVVVAIIAALDYWYQYNKFHNKNKMTKQELRDELKHSEGDPAVKSRLKGLRSKLHKQNLTTQMKQATVVITNPEHYAIALQYDNNMTAPICLAKGKNFIALKIREIARQNNIPVVENRTLARSLYSSAIIGAEIDPQHYQAVARIIGYIMNLNHQQLSNIER